MVVNHSHITRERTRNFPPFLVPSELGTLVRSGPFSCHLMWTPTLAVFPVVASDSYSCTAWPEACTYQQAEARQDKKIPERNPAHFYSAHRGNFSGWENHKIGKPISTDRGRVTTQRRSSAWRRSRKWRRICGPGKRKRKDTAAICFLLPAATAIGQRASVETYFPVSWVDSKSKNGECSNRSVSEHKSEWVSGVWEWA